MNWKVKLVLLFGKLRKPIDTEGVSLPSLRKKAFRVAKLGTLLLDKKVAVKDSIDIPIKDFSIRIYKNNNLSSQRVIIYFHGGGFALYGINSHDNVCRRWCQMNNCLVVSVGYRLAPEYTFPSAHNDAFSAIEWVLENIKTYGGNSQDIILAGDSAGGNLAACMAHKCKENGIPVTAQILIYPWIDGKLGNPSITKNGLGYLLERETMFWFQSQYTPRVEDHCNPEVSPCYKENFSGLAPMFIITAEYDPLIDDGYNYYKQVKSAGNKAMYKEYSELFHGFFNIPGVHPSAIECYHDIKRFLEGL